MKIFNEFYRTKKKKTTLRERARVQKNTLWHLIGSSSRLCAEHNRNQWKFKRNYLLLSSHSKPSNQKPVHPYTVSPYVCLLSVCVVYALGIVVCMLLLRSSTVSWDPKAKQYRRVFDFVVEYTRKYTRPFNLKHK